MNICKIYIQFKETVICKFCLLYIVISILFSNLASTLALAIASLQEWVINCEVASILIVGFD